MWGRERAAGFANWLAGDGDAGFYARFRLPEEVSAEADMEVEERSADTPPVLAAAGSAE